MDIPSGERCHNHPVTKMYKLSEIEKIHSAPQCLKLATMELAPVNVFSVPPEARTFYCSDCAESAVETGHYRVVNVGEEADGSLP